MSLRMQINGFSYSQMVSYFGSRDEGLKRAIAGEFHDHVLNNPNDKDTLQKAMHIIDTAIDKGIADSGIEVENEIGCHVVNLFAHHNQTHVLTDSSEWKMQVLWDIQEQYSSRLNARMNTFLRYFIEGRPVLGKKIQTSWSYYAYLLNQEVQELATEWLNIRTNLQDDPAFSKYSEFFDEFEGWMLTLLEQEKDLWFWAE